MTKEARACNGVKTVYSINGGGKIGHMTHTHTEETGPPSYTFLPYTYGGQGWVEAVREGENGDICNSVNNKNKGKMETTVVEQQ